VSYYRVSFRGVNVINDGVKSPQNMKRTGGVMRRFWRRVRTIAVAARVEKK
jgi:hypothetical protein